MSKENNGVCAKQVTCDKKYLQLFCAGIELLLVTMERSISSAKVNVIVKKKLSIVIEIHSNLKEIFFKRNKVTNQY